MALRNHRTDSDDTDKCACGCSDYVGGWGGGHSIILQLLCGWQLNNVWLTPQFSPDGRFVPSLFRDRYAATLRLRVMLALLVKVDCNLYVVNSNPIEPGRLLRRLATTKRELCGITRYYIRGNFFLPWSYSGRTTHHVLSGAHKIHKLYITHAARRNIKRFQRTQSKKNNMWWCKIQKN